MFLDYDPSLEDLLSEDLQTDASPPVSSPSSLDAATWSDGVDQISDNSPATNWLNEGNLAFPVFRDFLNPVVSTLKPPLEAIQWMNQSSHHINAVMETVRSPLIDIRPTLALAPTLTSFVSHDLELLPSAVHQMVEASSVLTAPPSLILGDSFSLPFATLLQETHSALHRLTSAVLPLLQVDLGLSGLSSLGMPPLLPDMGLFAGTLRACDDVFGDTLSGFTASLAPPSFADLALLPSAFLSNNLLGDVMSNLNASLATIPALLPPALKSFGEKFRQRILAAFERAKLFLAPSMSEDLIDEILYWAEAGDLRPVNLAVWRYYAQNRHRRLQQAIELWRDNPEFGARWQIIEAAFAAHRQGYYASSIRTLAPEIEGIASQVVVRNTLKEIRKKKEGLHLGSTESIILRMLMVAGNVAAVDKSGDLKHWLRVHSLTRFIEDVFCKTIDFEGQYYRIRSSRDLYRHSLSHGIQLGAFTYMNSLRLFLMLDAIHAILQGYLATGGLI